MRVGEEGEIIERALGGTEDYYYKERRNEGRGRARLERELRGARGRTWGPRGRCVCMCVEGNEAGRGQARGEGGDYCTVTLASLLQT